MLAADQGFTAARRGNFSGPGDVDGHGSASMTRPDVPTGERHLGPVHEFLMRSPITSQQTGKVQVNRHPNVQRGGQTH